MQGGGNDEAQSLIRNIFYVKCSSTVDEFIASLLYHKSERLWKQLEIIESTRGPPHQILRIVEGVTPTQITDSKLGLAAPTYSTKKTILPSYT